MTMKISNSSFTDYLKCPKFYDWRVNHRIVPKKRATSLVIGELVHLGLQNWKMGQELSDIIQEIDGIIQKYSSTREFSGEELDDIQIAQATIHGIVGAYTRRYARDEFKDSKPEEEFEYKISDDLTAIGRIDERGIFEDKMWLREYKSTSETNIPKFKVQLSIDPQATMYLWIMSKLHPEENMDGVIFDILRKPLLRQGKNEDISTFYKRIIDDYFTRPEFYLDRTFIYRNEHQLQEFEEDLIHTAYEIKQKAHWTKNRKQCFVFYRCDYQSLCWCGDSDINEIIKVQYEKREG